MKQLFAILFTALLCSAASAEEQDNSPLALQQARQVAKKASISVSNDAFILGSLVAKKEKRLQAANSSNDQKANTPVSE